MGKLGDLKDFLQITIYLVLEGLMVRSLECQEDRRSILDWICDKSEVCRGKIEGCHQHIK